MRVFVCFLISLIFLYNANSQTITPAGPVNLCPGGSQLLTVSGTTGTPNYQWQLNGADVGTNVNTYLANATGNYTVILTGAGPRDTLGPVVVTLRPAPIPTFTFNNNNICAGANIQFTSGVTVGTAPYSYSWNFGDGNNSTAQNPVHIYNSLGCGFTDFTATLTVTDAFGCTGTVSNVIRVLNKPDVRLADVDIFNPFSNCQNNPTTANPNYSLTVNNVSPSAACITSYTINWGDGTGTQTIASFPTTHLYTQVGAFNLVVTAVGTNGCVSTKTYIVANQLNPAGGLGTLGATTGLCAPSTIPFIINNWQNNSPGTTYVLNFGDNTSVTLNHPLNAAGVSDTVYHQYTTSSCPSATFTATLLVINACDSTPYTAGNIQVRIAPVASFTSSPDPGCAGQSVCFTNTTVSGSYGNNCSTITAFAWDFGDPASGANNTSTLQNPCHTFSAPGTYTVTLTSSNPCGPSVFTKQVCIAAPPVPSFTIDNAIGCAPLNVIATNTSVITNSCSQLTYLWSVTYAAGFCGTIPAWSFTNATNANSVNPSFQFTGPGTYTITLAVTNPCGTFTTTRIVTVKKPPTVVINAITNICAGGTINPSAVVTNCGTNAPTYAWTFPGGTPATSSSASPGPIVYSTAGPYTVSLSVTNECGTTAASTPFTVTPAPVVTAPSSQTVCNGTSTTAITFGGTGTSYTWTNNNTSIGLAASGTGNIPAFIAINTGSSPVTATITVTPVSALCNGIPVPFTITVNPAATVQFSAPNQTICSGAQTAAVNLTSSTASATISWTCTPPAGITGAALSGTTSIPVQTLINTTLTPLTVNYVAVATTTGSATCAGASFTYSIIVNPVSNVTQPANLVVCNATATTAISFASTVTGTTYTWTNNNTTIGLVASGTGNIPVFTAINTTTAAITATITVTPNYTTGSVTCPGPSKTFTITVNPTTVLTQPVNQVVCNGTATSAVSFSSSVTGTTHTWTNSNPAIGLPASGTGNIGSFNAINATAAPITATITVTPTYSNGGTACPGLPKTFTITINPTPTVVQPANVALCNAVSSAVISFTGAVTGTTYSWTNNNTSIGLAASGTGSIPVFTATNSTNAPVVATITVIPGYTNASVSCTGPSVTFNITVNPTPSVTAPANQVLCNGAPTTLVTFGGSTVSGTTYNWTNNNSSIGVAATGTNTIPSVTAINTGIAPVVATITATPVANSCSGTPASFTITVNPAASVQFSATDQTICSGGQTAAVNLTSTSSNVTIAWTCNIPAGITGAAASGTTTIPAQTLVNTTNSPITLNYIATATTTGTAACPGITSTYNITINPTPNVTANPALQSICSNASTNISLSSSVSGTVFNWTVTPNPNISGASNGTGNSIAQTLINNSNTIQTITYTITPAYTNNGLTCLGIPVNVPITINPKPAVTNTPLTQTICSAGTSIPVTFTSNVTGATYTWTAVSTAGLTGFTASGTAAIPAQTIVNSTTSQGTVTYTVTASANGCPGAPVDYTIVVNPKPAVTNTPLTQSICSGNSTSAVTIASNVTGANFTWTATATAGISGFISSGTGVIPVQTLINSIASVGTVTYVINPFINGCPGDPVNYIISVSPSPAVQFSAPDQLVCSGAATAAVNITSTTTGVNISWTCLPPAGITGAITNGTNNIPSQTLINTTNAPITVNYIAVATTTGGNACSGGSSIYSIIVNPSPIVQFSSADQTICSGAATTAVNLSTTTVAANISWTCTVLPGITGAATNGTSVIPVQTLINTTNSPITLNYIATATTTGSAACPGNTATYSITVNPTPMVSANPALQTICSGASTSISLASLVSGTTFSWTFATSGSITGASNGNGNLISQALINSSTDPQTVTYTITPSYTNNAVNCTGASISVTITINPSASINNSPLVQDVCTGNTTLPVTWSSLSAGSTYTWTVVSSTGVSGFINSGTGNLPAMSLINTGTTQASLIYAVTATVSTCPGLPTNYTIHVNPDAIARFTPTDTIGCPAFNITPSIIGLQVFPANNIDYVWYANDVQIGVGAVFPGYTINNENDSVTIKLKAISLYGCKADSMSRKFYTYILPHPSFELVDTVGCGPLTVQVLNTTPDIGLFTYFWNFGNGQTSTLQQPGSISFLPNPTFNDTTYQVSLQIFSICDTITITKTVRVKSKPKALFQPSITSGCSPMRVTFANLSGGLNNTYYWDFGDGATAVTNNLLPIQHIYNTGVQDTFYIKLVAVNECGSDSITFSIVAAPNNINLNFLVNGPNIYGCAPHTVAFFNNTSGASSFAWDFGDGNTLNTTQNIDTVFHTYLVAGTYTVTLTAQNSCTDTTTTLQITVFPKPTAAFIADRYTACIGDRIQFTNQSDIATSYLWQFGDGNTSTLLNPSHSYSAPGLYTVKLIIYRVNAPGNTCIDSTTQQVQIVSSLPGAFSLSATTGTCVPFTVTFVNQNRPSVTAVWDFGDGNTGSGDSVLHTYQTAGIYTVNLTVTVPGGCTYTSQNTVTVNGPSGSLQYTGGFKCYPDPVRFEATAINTSNLTWNFGDGNTLTTTQLVVFHNYVNPGIYIPTLTLQNAAGCNYFIPGIDTIKVDKIDAGFTVTQQKYCGSTNVVFRDTSNVYFGKALVKWDFGDGNTGTGITVNHNYSITGNYTVQMIVIGISGCTDTVTQVVNVFVNSLPVAGIVAVANGCTSQPVLFSGLVQSTDPINIYQWTISNGVNSGGQDFTYTFATPGIFTVRFITGTVNGCYDTATHTITISPSPVVTVTPSLSICLGNSVQLNASGATQFDWAPSQGLSCITCANPVATPVITTPYVVTGTNSFGCTSQATVVVTVIQPLNMTTSGNDTLCISQSVNLQASGAASYIWTPAQGLNNPRISNPTASPVVTTTYRVVGYDGFSCFTDTAFIVVAVGQYPTVNLGPDKTLSTGTILPLTTTITNGPIRDWLWTPDNDLSCNNCPLPNALIKNDIRYVVNVTNIYGCSASDSINIKVFCTDAQVFIPNGFSPDGDGINDILMVRGKGILSVKSFRIFNRWGEVVFEKINFPPNNPAYGWNGKIKGIEGPPDVFVYTAEVICDNGTAYTYKGNVSLIK